MIKTFTYASILCAILLQSCVKENSAHLVKIKNTLDISRSNETVELKKSDVKLKQGEVFENMSIQDIETGKVLVSQFIDEDQDGVIDVVLFQPKIDANSEKQYKLVALKDSDKLESVESCYSRFVPERTDDYAWENDKVAFRAFGPTAQKMIEDAIEGGTLTSGVDAWLKKVDYPIINKWYAKNVKEIGAYHIDSGEGLDNFHVGVSRGVGGIAVKNDTTYYTSKNFTKWKTITTGPLRTSFELEYADWDANGKTISVKKYISLDLGSNLSKFEIDITGTDNFYSGLTLHENDGVKTQNNENGWVSYWQPHGDSELGTAIVTLKGDMIASESYETTVPDLSHLFAQIQVNSNKGVYYAGFTWKKAKQFETKEAWEKYLNDFALKINNPLLIF